MIRRRRATNGIWLAGAAAALALCGADASAVVGTARIQVTDHRGRPVPEVVVTFVAKDDAQVQASVRTDKDGHASLKLEEGKYRFRAVIQGRVVQEAEAEIQGGGTTWVTITVDAVFSAPPPAREGWKYRVEAGSSFLRQDRPLRDSFPSRDETTTFEGAPINVSPPPVSVFQERVTETVTALTDGSASQWHTLTLHYRPVPSLILSTQAGAAQVDSDFTKVAGTRTSLVTNLFPGRLGGVKAGLGSSGEGSVERISPADFGGGGNPGVALGAGAGWTFFRRPGLRLRFEGRWRFFEGGGFAPAGSRLEIRRTRTNSLDVGAVAEFGRGRFRPFAGAKSLWLWTRYKGSLLRVVEEIDLLEGVTVTVLRSPVAFRTRSGGFPLVGSGGFSWALTRKTGLRLEALLSGETRMLSLGVFRDL